MIVSACNVSTAIDIVANGLTPQPRGVCPPHPIKGVWRLLGEDWPILEIRALPHKGARISAEPVIRHFRRRDYEDLKSLKSDFEGTALSLNAQGLNLYTVMNPIRPDFSGPGGAKDSDIEHRAWLLIDLDRKGDTSRPASEEELDAAREVARSIRDYLASLGWPPPLVMGSGNGVHCYYRLANLENSEAVGAHIKRALQNLSTRFDSDKIGVDRVVYNAARITKIPGTIARKGIESEGRPYRMAMIVDDL